MLVYKHDSMNWEENTNIRRVVYIKPLDCRVIMNRGYVYVSFNSQLTPHPQPLPLACGLWDTRKLLPMSSVAKSIVDPFISENDTASTRILEGMMLG